MEIRLSTTHNNNKSIDDCLRKTVDSQNEISYPKKNGGEIQTSSDLVVSPPFEIKKVRFKRKLREGSVAIKREDSSKNLLDEEFGEKLNDNMSSAEPDLAAAKLLDVSMQEYENQSMIRSRTGKEIEMTVSMTKNPIFKRSKVIVSKNIGSQEKEPHMASTNVTNSKSTYRNESIASNFLLKDESQELKLKKSDTVEIDFGFEDDISLRKKPEPGPIINKKLFNDLNVIAEENQATQKETILQSQSAGVISSQEFQKIVAIEPEDEIQTPKSPAAKQSSVKPLFFYCGNKLNKMSSRNDEFEDQPKLFDEDDLCVNGENNSDCDVVNSRVGLDTSMGNPFEDHEAMGTSDKNTIMVSKDLWKKY